MMLAHRIALNPNNKQRTYLAGTARFAYNWASFEWKKQYDACKVDEAGNQPQA